MPMGSCAGYAEVITEENLEKICPTKFPALVKALAVLELDTSDIAYAHYLDQDLQEYVNDSKDLDSDLVEEGVTNIINALQDLYKDFTAGTGLELDIGYHNSDDEGSCYDEVEGSFWCVGGLYIESPEYTQAKENLGLVVERAYFTTFC